MFNQGQFNLARFNVPRQTTAFVSLSTDAVELITAMLGISETVYLSTSAAEAYGVEAAAAQGILLTNTATEEVTAEARLIGLLLLQQDAQEAVTHSLRIGALVFGTADTQEAISAEVYAGAKVFAQTHGAETITAEALLGANVLPGNIAYEIISAQTSAEATDVFTISIDVTLKPGDTLVIDSDHYTVLHNGENILDKHSGDWLELSRNVRSVQVGSGTPATLKATVLYTERWL